MNRFITIGKDYAKQLTQDVFVNCDDQMVVINRFQANLIKIPTDVTIVNSDLSARAFMLNVTKMETAFFDIVTDIYASISKMEEHAKFFLVDQDEPFLQTSLN